MACTAGAEPESAAAEPRGPAETAKLPEAPAFPARWVLIESEPLLWKTPGAQPTNTRLEARAGASVEVLGDAPADDKASGWLHVRAGERSGWLPEALLAPPPQSVPADALEHIGAEPVDRFHGLPPDYAPADLVEVHFGYEHDRTYTLRREAALACEKMIRSARLKGLSIQIVSAYRSYEKQREVYLAKLKRSGWKQETVARPGHSEHQLGTTVDLTGANEAALLQQSFGQEPEGIWLREHAPEFGFAVSYTEHNAATTGYAPEPWHFRYFGPALAAERHAAALGTPRGK